MQSHTSYIYIYYKYPKISEVPRPPIHDALARWAMPTAEGRKQVGWNQGGTRARDALEILETLETRHRPCFVL
jgi:hypothetical protein